MSRKVAALLALIILVGAMGLKTAVSAYSSTTLVAQGGAPPPPAKDW